MNSWGKRSVLIFSVLSVAVITLGAYLQVNGKLPRGFERSGAAVAALVALFVIVQVAIEEYHERRLDEVRREADAVMGTRPTDVVARRIADHRSNAILLQRRGERTALVLAIAFWAFVGELVHGFGGLVIGDPEVDTEHCTPRYVGAAAAAAAIVVAQHHRAEPTAASRCPPAETCSSAAGQCRKLGFDERHDRRSR